VSGQVTDPPQNQAENLVEEKKEISCVTGLKPEWSKPGPPCNSNSVGTCRIDGRSDEGPANKWSLEQWAKDVHVVPTNHYGANSAWQQLAILVYNLLRSFRLHSAIATPKPRSRKRTYGYRVVSMKTLLFLFINRAARLARISGRKALRFSRNSATQMLLQPSR